MTEKQIDKDENLISYCGCYCGGCPTRFGEWVSFFRSLRWVQRLDW